jgi:RHS repeat-associated protein
VLNPNSRIGEKVGIWQEKQAAVMLSAETHRENGKAIREGSYGRFLYNFYRTYDPTTGRYLETDPIRESVRANAYEYANSDSVNFLDPNGLAPFRNTTSKPIAASGNPKGQGSQVPIIVHPGQEVNANNPVQGVTDVDSVDFDGDGVADPPESKLDIFPLGEKIVGGDTGLECAVVENPLHGISNPLHDFGIGPPTFSVGPRRLPYPSGWVK